MACFYLLSSLNLRISCTRIFRKLYPCVSSNLYHGICGNERLRSYGVELHDRGHDRDDHGDHRDDLRVRGQHLERSLEEACNLEVACDQRGACDLRVACILVVACNLVGACDLVEACDQLVAYILVVAFLLEVGINQVDILVEGISLVVGIGLEEGILGLLVENVLASFYSYFVNDYNIF